MEFNNPSAIVKDLNFGDDARNKIVEGVDKLAKAVKSTLGASGKCVIYEDALGKPVITKDGVTVAQSVVLLDPVANIGATLIKEASNNTVRDAGDGTTTAIVLAQSLLKDIFEVLDELEKVSNNEVTLRDIRNGIQSGSKKVMEYLSKHSKAVSGGQLANVSTISCNNDVELGEIIASAYEKVGKDGVVLMEESENEHTYVDIVDGVKMECGLISQHFITDTQKRQAVLEDTAILIVSSKITSIRKIQNILEHVIKNKKPLLIVADVDQQVKSALLMNKVKGNINVNIIDPPGFGFDKAETIEDLGILTGAKVINEELGDDLDLIQPDCLGWAHKSVTDDKSTVITCDKDNSILKERIDHVTKKLKKEKDPFLKKKLEERLAMLNGSVGLIRVGATSKVEMKEKKDRVEDAIHAVKAALQEGIIPGGGIALLNASNNIKTTNVGEQILLSAIQAPFYTILENAGIEHCGCNLDDGEGINVITGDTVNMIKEGIIDPVLVTKAALKYAVSVVNTIVSADCVISNVRVKS